MKLCWVELFTALQQVKDDSQQFAHAVPLSAAVSLTFSDLLVVIRFEYIVILDNRLYDLVKRLPKVLGSLFGNPCICRRILP